MLHFSGVSIALLTVIETETVVKSTRSFSRFHRRARQLIRESHLEPDLGHKRCYSFVHFALIYVRKNVKIMP